MDKNHPILPLETISFSSKLPLLEGQKNIFRDVIEWRTEPPLVKTGRSTYLLINDDNIPFKGIKIKGCGYFDVYKKEKSQPSTKEGYDAYIQNAPDGVKEIHYQIEVDENDELRYARPPKRPYGAQLYSKAKQEYEVNEQLLESWKGQSEEFPFYFPVGYAKYKDLNYKSEPLGVTLLGMPVAAETPLGSYFEGNFEDKGLRINPHLLGYWQKHIAVAGKNEPSYFDLLLTLKKLCFGFGKSMNFLHKHFVDFDSHFFNATVDNDTGNVILYDFDHVFNVKEISDQKYFYYMLKDFEIGLVAVLSNFMLSGLIEGILLFEKMNESIDDYNLINGFYKGYFGKLSTQAAEHAQSMWERLLLFTGNRILSSNPSQHLHLVHSFCEQERENSYIEIFPYLSDKIIIDRPNFPLQQEKHNSIIHKFLKQRETLEKLHQP